MSSISKANSVSTKKVPIYKNQQIEEKKTTDLYEFDEFDNVGEKNRNRNRKYDFNKSEKFDKSMHVILQRINIKEAKLQATNKRKSGKVGKSRKDNKPAQEIRKKVLSKRLIENKSGKAKRNKNIQNVANISQHKTQIPDINHPNELSDNSDRDDDEFFDFAGVEHSTPVKINPNIKIISNVIVNENDSTNLTDNLQQNANTTMLPSDKPNPWRFNENLKSNPHFIALKKTALPRLQQELQMEKNEHVTKKANETPKIKLVQKSLMDFMNVSPCEASDKENVPHSNLFDYDEFSPTKITRQDFSKKKVGRNILGARQDNFENIQANNDSTQNGVPPSVTSLIEFDKNDDVETYLGFDGGNERVQAEKKSERSEARPHRINRTVHKHTEQAADESLRKAENFTEFQEPLKYQAEVDGNAVGLFEDPEQDISLSMPSKIYQRKRRKRFLSADLDEEEGSKKKKNMMTKKEEAELEKWAAQFNSECDEIEKYKLEID